MGNNSDICSNIHRTSEDPNVENHMTKVNAHIIMIDNYSTGTKRLGTGYEV